MDSIIARGLIFYGKHGILESEKNNPQRIEVDLVLYKDLKAAGLNDDLYYTVDYSRIYNDVRDIVENYSFNLIESLAENICQKILSKYAVEIVETTVYKPCAPIDGEFEYFAVKIERRRK